MPRHLELWTNGPYLRVALPDAVEDWEAVVLAVAFGLEEQVERAAIMAPCYDDDVSLEGVRCLVTELEQRGVDAIVEWHGAPVRELAALAHG